MTPPLLLDMSLPLLDLQMQTHVHYGLLMSRCLLCMPVAAGSLSNRTSMECKLCRQRVLTVLLSEVTSFQPLCVAYKHLGH